jgi:hypothetical protein
MKDHDRNNISSGSFLVSRADCSAAYSLDLQATGRRRRRRKKIYIYIPSAEHVYKLL